MSRTARVASKVSSKKRPRREDAHGFARGEMHEFETALSRRINENPRYRRERRAFVA